MEGFWQQARRHFSLVVRVTERMIDRSGQCVLLPKVSLDGWWTSLAEPLE